MKYGIVECNAEYPYIGISFKQGFRNLSYFYYPENKIIQLLR